MSVTVGRPPRLALLSGAVFVVLVVIGFAAIGGSTPEPHDSARKVFTYYGDHHDKQMVAGFVVALSVPFLLIFSSVLYRTLRALEGVGAWLPTLAFGGGVMGGAGYLAAVAIHLALADAGDQKAPAATYTLNFLDGNSWPLFTAPIGVLVFATGFATFRGQGALPRWLGWVAVVVGLLVFTPVGFFAWVLSGLWILVASVVLYLRAAPTGAAAAT
jgi:hypothetical protein